MTLAISFLGVLEPHSDNKSIRAFVKSTQQTPLNSWTGESFSRGMVLAGRDEKFLRYRLYSSLLQKKKHHVISLETVWRVQSGAIATPIVKVPIQTARDANLLPIKFTSILRPSGMQVNVIGFCFNRNCSVANY